jgi:3-hydroxyacyl-CoA dehydrogenase
VAEIAREARGPERMAGLHFFCPVEKMALVEVVIGPETKQEMVGRLAAFVVELGKVPVPVRDSPGFLVNRLLGVYLGEALSFLAAGADPEDLDEALTSFGMPVGPLELMDMVGLRVAESVAQELYRTWPERMREPRVLRALVGMGRTGKASGAGIYDWDEDGRVFAPEELAAAGWSSGEPVVQEEVRQRLLLPMVDEAARVLEEGIVAAPHEVDLALVLGTGFPRFRGGLLRFADTIGISRIVERLEELSREHPSLGPSDAIRSIATRGGFYI